MDPLNQLMGFMNGKRYFDKAFPSFEYGFYEKDGLWLFKSLESGACAGCGTATYWQDCSWGIEVYTCSFECMNELWNEYSRACINPPTYGIV